LILLRDLQRTKKITKATHNTKGKERRTNGGEEEPKHKKPNIGKTTIQLCIGHSNSNRANNGDTTAEIEGHNMETVKKRDIKPELQTYNHNKEEDLQVGENADGNSDPELEINGKEDDVDSNNQEQEHDRRAATAEVQRSRSKQQRDHVHGGIDEEEESPMRVEAATASTQQET